MVYLTSPLLSRCRWPLALIVKRKINAHRVDRPDSSERGCAVASQGGYLLIKRVQPRGSPKVSTPDFARSVGLKRGERLG